MVGGCLDLCRGIGHRNRVASYAINTHRMLVRGTRVPYNGEDEETATPQTVQYQELHTGNVVKRMVDAWPWISVTEPCHRR